MSFAHFRRWARGAPAIGPYTPVRLMELWPVATPTDKRVGLGEAPDIRDPFTLAPILLHFVPGATAEERIAFMFRRMASSAHGCVTLAALQAGLVPLYVPRFVGNGVYVSRRAIY